LGGHVVGGLLAREIANEIIDTELQPARLTVDLLRRVLLEPIQGKATVVRCGRRMQSIDATLIQGGEVVARASALCLRRSRQPDDYTWTTPITMPPLPAQVDLAPQAEQLDLTAYGLKPDPADQRYPWQHDGRRYGWVCDQRQLVRGEQLTPFVRAAMAVDFTGSMSNFGMSGLGFINADFTMTLSRLPEGPFIGMASLTHYSDSGVATATASLFDKRGPIGNGVSTAISNPNFQISG
jgi:hypothetical protein